MIAGKLNKRIELQSYTEAQDGYGEADKTWSTYYTTWAAIRPLTGREALIAQQVTAETTVEIRIRYKSSVTTGNRIKFGERYYDINSIVNPDERNREMILMCKEMI